MTIAGIVVPMARVQPRPEVVGGEPERAEDGTLRTDARAVKRGYVGDTAHLTRTEAKALADAVALDQIVTVDASDYEVGAVFSAMVRAADGDVVNGTAADGSSILRTLTLTVREV